MLLKSIRKILIHFISLLGFISCNTNADLGQYWDKSDFSFLRSLLIVLFTD